MKKIITTICLAFFCLVQTSTLVFAQPKGGEGCRGYQNDCPEGYSCIPEADPDKIKNYSDGQTGVCTNLIDALTQRTSNASNPDSQALKTLPDVSLEGGMTLAIKAMLRSAMYLTIIAIVIAAIYYIISRGKDEDMTKAKDIILYLVIGMAIIAAAYGIVSGVAQFNVFG
jgi:hypothetical protein